MPTAFEYKFVSYDRANPIAGETEEEGVVRLLDVNRSQGWELDRFEDSEPDGQFRLIWLRRPVGA